MRKKFGIFIFFILTICSFAFNSGIGVLVSEKHKEVLEEKLNIAIKEEFTGEKSIPKVKQIQYFNQDNYETKFKNIIANKDISAVFVLDYENRVLPINTNKLVIYPFGIEDKKGLNTLNKVIIQGKLAVEEDLNDLKEIRDIKKVTYILPKERLKGNDTFIKSLGKAAEKNKMTYEILTLDENIEELKVRLKDTDLIYVISSEGTEEILKLGEELDKITYLVDFSGSKNESSLLGYNLDDERAKRIKTAVYNYNNRLKGSMQDSVVNLGVVKGERYFNLSQGKEQEIYPKREFVEKYKAVEGPKINAPLLTLEAAIKYGVDNNQKLRAAFNRANSSDYGYKASFAKRLPQVYGEVNYSYLESNSVTNVTQSHENITTGGIRISQVLFNSDLNAEIFSQKMNSKNSKLQFKDLTNTTIQNIIDGYLGVIQEESRLRVAKNNYEMLREFLKISNLKYETGSVGIQDVYRFEAEVARAQGDLSRAESNLANRKYNLNKILNLNVSTDHTFETTEQLSKVFSTDILPIDTMSYNGLVRERVTQYLAEGALRRSNTIQIAENNLSNIDNQYKAVRNSRFIPQVEGYARYNKTNIGASGTSIGTSLANEKNTEYWTAGVGAKIPLFTSGEITYKQKGLAAEREAVTNDKNSAVQEIESGLNTELSKMLGAYSEFKASEITKNSARRYLEIVTSQYRVGSIGITDLLEAKNTYITAEMSNIIANYDFYNSLIAVERTYGEFIFMRDKAERKIIKYEIESLIRN